MAGSLSALLCAFGCGSEKSTSTDMTGAATDMAVAAKDMADTICTTAKAPEMPLTALLGTWLSEGADVAPLLANAPFNFTRITAAFQVNTYTVTATTKGGSMGMFTGVYTTTVTTVPGVVGIKLMQSAPSVATSEGMYLIDTRTAPSRLYYEVLQTQPPVANTSPPKPELCFGSTVGPPAGNNIQKFSRQ